MLSLYLWLLNKSSRLEQRWIVRTNKRCFPGAAIRCRSGSSVSIRETRELKCVQTRSKNKKNITVSFAWIHYCPADFYCRGETFTQTNNRPFLQLVDAVTQPENSHNSALGYSCRSFLLFWNLEISQEASAGPSVATFTWKAKVTASVVCCWLDLTTN